MSYTFSLHISLYIYITPICKRFCLASFKLNFVRTSTWQSYGTTEPRVKQAQSREHPIPGTEQLNALQLSTFFFLVIKALKKVSNTN